MRRTIVVALATLSLALSAAVALHAANAEQPIPFERGSWAKLTAEHAGQPTIIHFWGLTCGPCIVEMPNWGKLLAERPDMHLVLVAADPLPQSPEQVNGAVQRAQLEHAESWSFADRFYERLRFEIDPAWNGELPRTLLIAADGSRTVLTGVADLSTVRKWLDAQPRPRN
jgi:thiol-disulfide isomerase/thioredoxin